MPDSTFSVRSAVVRIHQSGILKGTTTRVPLSAGNEANPGSTFKDLANVSYYYHLAGDYSPPPSVRLEASAANGAVSPKVQVRLVAGGGAAVAGSSLDFTSPQTTTLTSAPLTLSDTGLYHVQVRADAPGATLFLARLIFDQSAPSGIRRTVEWLPSVSFATSFTANNTPLNAPVIAPSLDQASALLSTWVRSVATVQGTGSIADVVMQQGTTTVTHATFGPDTGYMYRIDPVALPSVGSTLDSIGQLFHPSTTNPLQGTVSSSALRVAADLFDADWPSGALTGSTDASLGAFSPNGRPVTFNGSFTDRTPPITWTFNIVNAAGATLRTNSGRSETSPATVNQVWDGRDANGQTQPDGAYQARLTVTDALGNSGTTVKAFRVDRTPDVITWAGVSAAFNPGFVYFAATFSRPSSYTLDIADANDVIVRHLTSGATQLTMWQASWDGKDSAGSLVPEGTYTGTLIGTDLLGNQTNPVHLQTIVDRTQPTIGALQSPTASLIHDTVPLQVTAQDVGAGVGSVQFKYRRVNTDGSVGAWTIIKTVQSAGPFIYDWPTTSVLDGQIDLCAVVVDKAGNVASNTPFRTTVANQAPTIAGFAATPSAFSPAGNSTHTTTTLAASLSDPAPPISWTIAITNASGSTVQTFSGTGTTINQPWTGLDTDGHALPDGAYTATITATNAASQTSVAATPIIIDSALPSLTLLNPLTGSTTSFAHQTFDALADDASGSGIDPSTITLSISKVGGSDPPLTPAVTYTNSHIRTAAIALTPGATYNATLAASDGAGNLVQTSGTITVADDTIAASNHVLSPNGDAVKDTTTISDTLNTPGDATWTLSITNDQQQTVRAYPGSGTTITQTWDGRDDSGTAVPDGTYRAQLRAEDTRGDQTITDVEIVVDTTTPTIANIAPGPMSNTLWRRPAIEETITDAPAGIDPATIIATLDGETLTGTYDTITGRYHAMPTADLAIDVYHALHVEAIDNAGNWTTKDSRFRVVNVEQTSAAASIPALNVPVPSTCVNGCLITLAGAHVDVQSHTVTISSSAHAGNGAINHPIDLSSAYLRWHTPNGYRDQPLSINSVTSQEHISIESSSDSPVTITVPAAIIPLQPITVNAPLDVSPNSVVQLIMGTAIMSPACSNTSWLAQDPSRCGFAVANEVLEPIPDPLLGNGMWNFQGVGGVTARWGASAAWDDKQQELVMFGGCAKSDGTTHNPCLAENEVTNETLTWKPSATSAVGTWTSHDANASWPSPRYGAALAYDPHLNKVVMFGGIGGSEDVNHRGALQSDAWQWDGANWTPLLLALGSPQPSARVWAGFATDNSDYPVLFGGCTAVIDPNLCDRTSGYNADTWRLATTPTPQGPRSTWINECVNRSCGAQPSGRISMMFANYPKARKAILFGGEASNGTSVVKLNDMYAWDGNTKTWSDVLQNSTYGVGIPSKRSGAGFANARDGTADILLMYGGGESDDSLFNETWTFDLLSDPQNVIDPGVIGKWTKCSSCNEPYAARALSAFSSIGDGSGKVLMFGGMKQRTQQSSGNSFNGTYRFG